MEASADKPAPHRPWWSLEDLTLGRVLTGLVVALIVTGGGSALGLVRGADPVLVAIIAGGIIVVLAIFVLVVFVRRTNARLRQFQMRLRLLEIAVEHDEAFNNEFLFRHDNFLDALAKAEIMRKGSPGTVSDLLTRSAAERYVERFREWDERTRVADAERKEDLDRRISELGAKKRRRRRS